MTPSPLGAALAYIARGWSPIPIDYRKKGPRGSNWQNLRITVEDAHKHFNGAPQNIGIILGGGLTDLDLDCREALIIAPCLLPRTKATFGRKSKRYSHWLFYTDLHETAATAAIQFKDPNLRAEGDNADDKVMLLELRIGGGGRAAQTIFPPSTHKDTGELIEWERGGDGEPATISGADLLRAAKEAAAACLFARYWPRVGGRHDAALVLGGFLARAGIDIPHIKVFSEAVARAADADVAHTVRCAADSAKAHADGQAASGYQPPSRYSARRPGANVRSGLDIRASPTLVCKARTLTRKPERSSQVQSGQMRKPGRS